MKKDEFETLTDLLPTGWEEASKRLGAFARSRKIKNPLELLKLNLLYLTTGQSFGKTAAVLNLTENTCLNKNAVYERILKSAGWLEWLCTNLCRNEGFIVNAPAWLQQRRVCLVDASDEAKPGSNGADYRLHYLIGLFQLNMVEMHLTKAAEGEKITRFSKIQKKDIVLGDRAYGTLKGITYLKQREADFIFRLRANAFNLYFQDGTQAVLPELLQHLQAGELADLHLFYKEDKSLIPIRICAIGKDEQAQIRGLNHIKKSNSNKMRGKVSPLQELFNRFIIVASSLPEEVASTENIMELYRMRWQIELVFKRLKSIFGYGELPSRKEDAIRSWFYGKLFLAAICEALANKGRFSP